MLFVVSTFLFSIDKNHNLKEQVSIMDLNNSRPVLVEDENAPLYQSSREEIDLWFDDFEEDLGWTTGPGWQWTDSDSYSPNNSMNSPNDLSTQNASWDLLSPTITLPQLGEGETMNFGFYLNVDMPDSDGDNDNGLEDYYTVSIMDTDALAWHPSATDSYDGNSWWCSDESVGASGGYLDSWIQFMDTPSFTVPANGTMSADMKWTIESPAGAVVAGTCTDGWDAANVQISVDGGTSWELLTATSPLFAYDFQCGYGWLWNSSEYDTNGSLNHLAAGWGGDSGGWNNISFDLSQYAGQEAMIRFAFGSDPAYCTLDDASITGFLVDNVLVEGALDCNPENGCETSVSGAVWVDQFYDYFDDGTTYDPRPGSNGWEEYLPGYPFNGNVFLDISDFAGKDVMFRIQSRYDDNDDGGVGAGLFIDDFRIYKISGGNYPSPWDLSGEPLDQGAQLTWADMNASGEEVVIYDNDSFTNGIQMSTEGSTAFAGAEINMAGGSNVNTVSIFNIGDAGTSTIIAGFGQQGTLYNNEPLYQETVTLDIANGWNDFVVDWDFNNSFIIAHQFTYVDETTGEGTLAALDESAVPSTASMVLFSGGSWDAWSVSGAAIGDGEWGIRAGVSFSGANVTYNVYRDGLFVGDAGSTNSYTDSGLTNNTDYEYSVTAVYSDGEESDQSESIVVTPQAQTVHEEYHDDGSAEEFFNAGSGNFTAVRYGSGIQEDLVRFKWYQDGDGGAFYLKVYADDQGMPGAEVYSRVMAGGLVDGWNTYDLSTEGLVVEGDFWIGTKEFSSTKAFGVDTDSGDSGNSYSRVGSTGEWTPVAGNLMIRVYLDCGENCDSEPECSPADVNNDGTVNVLDIVSTVNFVMGLSSPNDQEQCASDLNGDGLVNVLDIVAMVNVIVGG